MSRIVVDLGWVADLKGDIDSTTEALTTAPRNVVSLGSSPGVASGVTRFMRKWDSRAEELAGCLDSVSEFLGAVHEGFSVTDDELANATSCDE